MADEDVLDVEGRAVSPEDLFFLEAQWRRIEKGPEIVSQAGKEIMGVVAVLSGVYMAVVALADPMETIPGAWRGILTVPYVGFIAAFVLAWVAFCPEQWSLPRNAPRSTREWFSHVARRNSTYLRYALWALFVSLLLMAAVIGYALVIAGEVAT